jgi:BirA family biotin operon repressor/biotin-[acetyl-CoA-carboxylase] ligase
MLIKYLKQIDSTHKYLKKYINSNCINENICFFTNHQTNGIGSRNNKWIGEDGNLFFSFLILEENLPKDLPLQSSSIYFSFLLKEILANFGSKLLLKWPNDFYINDGKIGGTITTKINNYFLCGIGINLKKNKLFSAHLDINISNKKLLKTYFLALEEYPSWKQVFSKYKLEFHNSKKYFTYINGKKIALKDKMLNNDGSLTINGERVFGLR